MQAGVINDCIDSDTLNLVADTLRSKQEPFFTEHSVTWPSNRNTKFFPILEAKIYPLLKDHFDPMEIVIINYTECMRPLAYTLMIGKLMEWGLHTCLSCFLYQKTI